MFPLNVKPWKFSSSNRAVLIFCFIISRRVKINVVCLWLRMPKKCKTFMQLGFIVFRNLLSEFAFQVSRNKIWKGSTQVNGNHKNVHDLQENFLCFAFFSHRHKNIFAFYFACCKKSCPELYWGEGKIQVEMLLHVNDVKGLNLDAHGWNNGMMLGWKEIGVFNIP